MIPRLANLDLHSRFPFSAGALGEEFRIVRIRGKGEARRPPGALANPTRAERLQSRSDTADSGAGEAAAALGPREMVADEFLNPGDAVAERVEILFGGAGQDLHERAAADFGRRIGRETRQLSERARFRCAMRALEAGVEYEEDAPVAGKIQLRHDRRNLGVRPPARVDGQAAALEQSDAHARTRAAIEQARILARIERQAGRRPKRSRDHERELSPGAKPGVRGNGARDDELFVGTKAKAFGDAAGEARAPLALVAQNLKAWCFAQLNAGFECVNSETNRSEASAKIPGKIEKTQMQARRRRDLNASQLRASLHIRSPLATWATGSEHCESLPRLPSAAMGACRRVFEGACPAGPV